MISKKLINAFKSESIGSLFIITDFDATLTKAYSNGKRSSNTLNVFRNKLLLGPKYSNECQVLFDKYHPYEKYKGIDSLIKGKNHNIEIWFNKQFELLKKYQLRSQHIDEIVTNNYLDLRDNFDYFFKFFNSWKVPVIVYSAGIGNIIQSVLETREVNMDFTNIIANNLLFNEDGIFVGKRLSEKIITPVNKTYSHIKENDFYKKNINGKRKNVILIGDSLTDSNMLKGSNSYNIIRVGIFFNKGNNNKFRRDFEGSFDFIIREESDLYRLLQIIEGIYLLPVKDVLGLQGIEDEEDNDSNLERAA